jgi:glycosyltransferase involved in cell wall biosynthesis
MAHRIKRSAGVPRVLLLTGAYDPEVSASAVQCQAVARQLGDRCRFLVVTTAVDRSLPRTDQIEEVVVHRIPIDVRRLSSKIAAFARVVSRLIALAPDFDLLHIHAVSQKNVPATFVAKLLGKKVVLTLHTAGQEEPEAVRRRGPLMSWALRSADRVITVSPQLTAAYRAAGLPEAKLKEIANGVDTQRFRPADGQERGAIRRALALPEEATIMLFVGFFSRDKRPHLAFDIFRRVAVNRPDLVLVYVGATDASSYREIDGSLAPAIADAAHAAGLGARVVFRPPTLQIEQYYRAADVFVMPSARESFSLVLLEAMSCGLPSAASRLEGATDILIDDGESGCLVPADDADRFTAAVESLLSDRERARRFGERAREAATARFGIARCAEQWLDVYRGLLAPAL